MEERANRGEASHSARTTRQRYSARVFPAMLRWTLPEPKAAFLEMSEAEIIESARTVLTIELRALENLIAGLDTSMSAAVRLVAGCKGRVILSGVGKSGAIAGKIAATMASTGTPAHYVDPTEASHGDLGKIVQGDVLVMFSKSGETVELTNEVEHAHRLAIPMIAVTANAQSMLAKAADVVLLLPPEPEAGCLGLAPTTSTIMMLALGDALAMVAAEIRGFTKDDFLRLHPAGALGKLLQTRKLRA